MPSLVPDFIINPVLRQARRFSNTSATPNRAPALDQEPVLEPPTGSDDGIPEMGGDILGPEDPVGRVSGPISSAVNAIASVPSRSLPRRFRASPSSTPPAPFGPADHEQASLPVRPNTALGSAPIDIGAPQRNARQDVPSSLPTSFYSRAELPEDDGMGTLRRRIVGIQSRSISASEKARL